MNNLNHVAFIMDGNRRWAKKRSLLPQQGHYFGLKAMKKIIKYSLENEIKNISFFAFSTENWKRSQDEINYLIELIDNEINNKKIEKWLIDNNIVFIWNGFEQNINQSIIKRIKFLMDITKNNTGLKLQILFNYGSTQKIIEAFNILRRTNNDINFDQLINQLDPYKLGPIDLLIRTGNEKRLSNFMLLELAYSEIIFNKNFWPSYNEKKFQKDILEYHSRSRRFGS